MPERSRTRNREIASDRVIVENFYGRMKLSFNIIDQVFRNDLVRFDTTFDVCVALTNFILTFKPLRAEDGDYHRKWLRKMNDAALAAVEVRKRQYSESKERRLARIRNNFLVV